MLLITDNEILSTQATKNKKNQKILSDTAEFNIGKVGGTIKNLSIIANLAKFKKPKLTKSEKLDLSKINFVKVNFKTNFLTFKAKNIFIYL